MKKILAFALIFILLISSSCTKKEETPDAPIIVDMDTQTEAEDNSAPEQEEQTSSPVTEEDEITEDSPDEVEKEQPIEIPDQAPQQQPDIKPEDTPEDVPEQEPEEQPEQEKVIYDDSNATSASSFKYTIKEEKNEVYITGFIGSEKDVTIPNYIEGYPVTIISSFRTYFPKDDSEKDQFTDTSMIESLTIPESVKVLSPNSIDAENLKTVIVKGNDVTVWGWAFNYCPSLTSVTFEGNVSLERVIFKSGKCAKLEEVVFLADAPKKLGDGNFLFNSFDQPNTVIKYKKGTKGWDDPIWKDFELVEIE